MKKLTVLVVILVAIAFIGSAFAVMPGKTQEFKTPMGKVTFSGQIHKDKGVSCALCHPKVFKMKAGSFKATVADHNAGEKFCWSCHNGTKKIGDITVFGTKGNCKKCHVK